MGTTKRHHSSLRSDCSQNTGEGRSSKKQKQSHRIKSKANAPDPDRSKPHLTAALELDGAGRLPANGSVTEVSQIATPEPPPGMSAGQRKRWRKRHRQRVAIAREQSAKETKTPKPASLTFCAEEKAPSTASPLQQKNACTIAGESDHETLRRASTTRLLVTPKKRWTEDVPIAESAMAKTSPSVGEDRSEGPMGSQEIPTPTAQRSAGKLIPLHMPVSEQNPMADTVSSPEDSGQQHTILLKSTTQAPSLQNSDTTHKAEVYASSLPSAKSSPMKARLPESGFILPAESCLEYSSSSVSGIKSGKNNDDNYKNSCDESGSDSSASEAAFSHREPQKPTLRSTAVSIQDVRAAKTNIPVTTHASHQPLKLGAGGDFSLKFKPSIIHKTSSVPTHSSNIDPRIAFERFRAFVEGDGSDSSESSDSNDDDKSKSEDGKERRSASRVHAPSITGMNLSAATRVVKPRDIIGSHKSSSGRFIHQSQPHADKLADHKEDDTKGMVGEILVGVDGSIMQSSSSEADSVHVSNDDIDKIEDDDDESRGGQQILESAPGDVDLSPKPLVKGRAGAANAEGIEISTDMRDVSRDAEDRVSSDDEKTGLDDGRYEEASDLEENYEELESSRSGDAPSGGNSIPRQTVEQTRAKERVDELSRQADLEQSEMLRPELWSLDLSETEPQPLLQEGAPARSDYESESDESDSDEGSKYDGILQDGEKYDHQRDHWNDAIGHFTGTESDSNSETSSNADIVQRSSVKHQPKWQRLENARAQKQLLSEMAAASQISQGTQSSGEQQANQPDECSSVAGKSREIAVQGPRKTGSKCGRKRENNGHEQGALDDTDSLLKPEQIAAHVSLTQPEMVIQSRETPSQQPSSERERHGSFLGVRGFSGCGPDPSIESPTTPPLYLFAEDDDDKLNRSICELAEDVLKTGTPLPLSEPNRLVYDEDTRLTYISRDCSMTTTKCRWPIFEVSMRSPLQDVSPVAVYSANIPENSQAVDEEVALAESEVTLSRLSEERPSCALADVEQTPSTPPQLMCRSPNQWHEADESKADESKVAAFVEKPKKRRITGMTSKHFTPEKRTRRKQLDANTAEGSANETGPYVHYNDAADASRDIGEATLVAESIHQATAKRKSTGTRSEHFMPLHLMDRVDLPLHTRVRDHPPGISHAVAPSINSERFGIIQEKLWREPFWLLVAVTFLNKTGGRAATPTFWKLKERFPTPEAVAAADQQDLHDLIRHLGLQNQRSKRLIAMSKAWATDPPVTGKRYKTTNYPAHGDHSEHKAYKEAEVIEGDVSRCTGALEIGHIPGCGPYAWDSWRIFCRDVLRGVAEDYNGKGAVDEGFQPEWQRVLPLDKELRATLRWMWLREGWIWHHETGEKRRATDEETERAVRGEMDVADLQEGKFAAQAAGAETP